LSDPISWVDPWGLERYVIVVGDPGLGSHNVGQNFLRAANTRAQNLGTQGHTVDITRASNVTEFNNAITAGDTITGGVIYYGHGWSGSLYIGEDPCPGTNLDRSNVSQLSSRNLGSAATVELNSCNSGAGGRNSIAQLVATQLQRTTYGYNSPLGFTGTPGVYNHNRYPPSTGPLYVAPTPGGSLVNFQP
jgi:hypothetical protein